ncbi:uncharacterized protein [Epargyreus clarus]|uniref:uncharacterized protein n=1 Tax=Epargyreus clarus TaxID=520877 RepID=UPI003C30371E
MEMPDLNFDADDGDVLKPVLSDTVPEIFENSPSTAAWQPEAIQKPEDLDDLIPTSKEIDTQPDLMDINAPTYTDIENKIEPIVDETPGEKPTDELIFDSFKPFIEQDKLINNLPEPSAQEPLSDNEPVENIYANQEFEPTLPIVPEQPDQLSLPQIQNTYLEIPQDSNNNNQPLQNIKKKQHFDPMLSYLPQQPSQLLLPQIQNPYLDIPQDSDNNNQPLENINKKQHFDPMLSYLPQQPGQLLLPQIQNPYLDIPQDSNNNNQPLENINKKQDFDPMLSYLPQQSGQVLIPQIQNPYLDIPQGSNNIKFNDWFNKQLSYVVLYDSGKQSNMDELRKNIRDVLEKNGIFVSNAGFLINQGNVLKMSNVMLRPILIGDPVEYQTFNQQTGYYNVAPAEISYHQMILIISIDPPEVLGVVPMGKAFLPRKINTQTSGFIRNKSTGKKHFLKLSPHIACKNCKSQITPKAELGINELPYFELPLRRNNDNRRDQNVLIRGYSRGRTNTSPQPQRRTSSDGSNDLGSMLQNLLGIFGTNILGDQTRRLLGGKMVSSDKPGPRRYPNDDVPDYRIIGGKPATSSGTPLVSKGRSGYNSG